MTAFVLGATGFVGREVVRQLCVRGTQVVAHVRPDSPQLATWQRRFAELGAELDATPWQASALAARLRALDPAQVYILIGTTRARARADAIAGNIYEAVDLGLTQIAVEAARASERRPRLVYLSSVGADAKARSPYLSVRARAEQAVTGAGLPWVIARPSFIVGDRGTERDDHRRGERGMAAFGDGLLAALGMLGGKQLRERYRSTTPDILASALIRIGEGPAHDRIVDGADLR